MPLRALNNPNDPLTLMSVMARIIAQGTTLATMTASGTGYERVHIQDRDELAQAAYPAILLMAASSISNIQSNALFDGTMKIKARYYDRWDTQALTLEAIKNNIYAEILRMEANIQSNNTLAYLGAARTVSVPTIEIADAPDIDESIPGLKLVYRDMVMSVNTLPYGV